MVSGEVFNAGGDTKPKRRQIGPQYLDYVVHAVGKESVPAFIAKEIDNID